MLASQLFYILAITGVLVHSQATSSQGFWPAAVPLAVRSPYFNSWMFTEIGKTPLNLWPNFWNGHNILGWSGYVRIDGLTYQWLGQSGNTTNLTSTMITPTRSIFTIQAGPMLLNVTFLSPIEPSDLVRQSLPFSYVYVDAMSVDGQSHSVQMYSDISAEWLSGNHGNPVKWNTTQTSTAVYHQAQRTSPAPMQENDDIAEDSTVYYSMATTPSMTWQTGKDTDVRGRFATDGKLTNSQDTAFRAIQANFPVFAFAVDLARITATSSPTVWTIGLVRDPVIRSVDNFGRPQDRSSYFWTQYPTIGAAIDAFVMDFPDAQKRASTLDEKIIKDAMVVSPEYADLLSLAARQTIGATELTISKGFDSRWNTSDVKMFMRSIGDGRRVSPVEIMYASFPMFLYLNANMAGYLLDPLLQYQNAQPRRSPYASPDLGISYPNAMGNTPDSDDYGVEDSGNMLIMTLAHAKISGDGSLIGNNYDLLKRWTDYLVANSMNLVDQMTADNQNKANMTNLAIKGIIGIQAMSEISRVFGKSDDAQNYATVASSYVKQWQTLAGSSGHLLSSYSQPESWGLIYNLFADRLLRTNLVDPKIYDAQEKFYNDQASKTPNKFGLAINSDAGDRARSDWTLFTASTLPANATRNLLVSMVHTRASFNQTPGPFPTLYNVSSGNSSTGQASPAQGAMFAILSLNLQHQTIKVPLPKSSGTEKRTNVGAIAGGVVGGVVLLALLAVLSVLVWRRRGRKRDQITHELDMTSTEPHIVPTPYVHEPSPPTTVNANPWRGKLRIPLGSSSKHLPSGPSASTSSTSWATPPPSDSVGRTSDLDPAVQLRTEVEHIRREVEELRSRQAYEEPPPSYG